MVHEAGQQQQPQPPPSSSSKARQRRRRPHPQQPQKQPQQQEKLRQPSNQSKQQQPKQPRRQQRRTPGDVPSKPQNRKNILVLHGNRQNGEILLSRMDKLRKKLHNELNIGLIAPDAPFLWKIHENADDGANISIDDNNNTNQKNNETTTNNNNVRTWWNQSSPNVYDYCGLSESIHKMNKLWHEYDTILCEPLIGIIGFSQGAKLAHFVSVIMSHQQQKRTTPTQQYQQQMMFPGCRFVILVAAYDVPTIPISLINDFILPQSNKEGTVEKFPENIVNDDNDETSMMTVYDIPSLHVWGEQDTLITPSQSLNVAKQFISPHTVCEIHPGGHYVPMKASNVETYFNFICQHAVGLYDDDNVDNDKNKDGNLRSNSNNYDSSLTDSRSTSNHPNSMTEQELSNQNRVAVKSDTTWQQHDGCVEKLQNESEQQHDPGEENWQAQCDEVEALQVIFPDEFHLLSSSHCVIDDEIAATTAPVYQHPIKYAIDIKPNNDETDDDTDLWPTHPIAVQVEYPYNYPTESIPIITFITGKNNGMQITSSQADACRQCMIDAAQEEYGMPCVLSIVYAAQSFFQSGRFNSIQSTTKTPTEKGIIVISETAMTMNEDTSTENSSFLKPVSTAKKMKCNLEGLQIADLILQQNKRIASDDNCYRSSSSSGGSWTFTIGLVGKPSAGKSTLFNTATAFARQRRKEGDGETTNQSVDDDDNAMMAQLQLGGATMAPHPFTTIDPNIGYCLVPAPDGSCPEDDYRVDGDNKMMFGSSHGRGSNGRRLLPVLLKDVAGLVPGAYQGRGRGNQFLNDLCDADVLVHVVDSSGMADTEGNIVGVVSANNSSNSHCDAEEESNHIVGSHPLNDMAWIRNELIEWVYTNIMYKWETIRKKGRGKLSDMFSGYGQQQATTLKVLDAVEKHLEESEHRDRALDHLVEWDEGDVHRLVSAFLGVRFPIALALNKCDLPTSKKHIQDIISALPIHGTYVGTPVSAKSEMQFMKYNIEQTLGILSSIVPESSSIPTGTWRCLQSAVSLREVVLVFPVADFTNYAPIPGLCKYSTNDSSLPSPGMIACLQAAGGSAPTMFDPSYGQYTVKTNSNDVAKLASTPALRDVIMMKPGSTVEDVFLALKRMGALGGEFVRAEGTSDIGVPPKPVPKHQIVTKKVRIIKIMTNKRTKWQQS